jgi:PAS domain S-box-containing protein
LPEARATDRERIGKDVVTHASLQAIVDCVAMPVWVVDHGGFVVLANPAALAALGFDALDELVGRHGHDTVHYQHPDGTPYPAEECPVLEPTRTGEPITSDEDWFFRRDGSMFPVSYTAVPIELATGRGVVVTFVDMSAQRQAEQALRERDAILARVAQPVWVVDHRGRFRYVNPAALTALGYDDPSELVGKPGHDTVHHKYPDGRPFPEEECAVARARHGGSSHVEHDDWLVRKDGSILRIAYSTAPFELPEGLGAVTAFTDIETRLQAEQAARERDVAAARAAELAAARRRIIEAADAARAQVTRDLHDGAQQQFVSALLTLQLAERTADAEASAQLRAVAEDQTRQGIAELRDLAAGLHPGILTDRGLSAAVDALASRMPIPVDIAVNLERRLPAPAEASLYFFVSEALANVVKHARATHARVRICVEDEHLIVEIADDGAGGAAPTAGGTGLAGLSDRIAALDGELTLTSPPGGGTLLHATVPLIYLP